MSNVFNATFKPKSIDNLNYLTHQSAKPQNPRIIHEIDTWFAHSTLIATTQGERQIAELQRGDRVITRDNGIQGICWIGHRVCDHPTAFTPILIREGALGAGVPEKDLLVSPQQGILITRTFVEGLNESEVLVPAKFLVGFEGIEFANVTTEPYYCIMFERHEVVLSNGIWSESLKPDAQTLAGIDEIERCEIIKLFPKLKTELDSNSNKSARRSLGQDEAIKLVG